MKSIIIKSIFILSGLLSTIPVLAQGAPPGTPIDGGLSLLLAAGGAYGVKKALEKRRRE